MTAHFFLNVDFFGFHYSYFEDGKKNLSVLKGDSFYYDSFLAVFNI